MSTHDTQGANNESQQLKKTIIYIIGAVIAIAILLVASYLIAGAGREANRGESELELDGTAWVLENLSGQELIPDTVITGEFADGNFGGTAGCNTYFTSYETAGETLKFGPAGSTMMFCELPEGVMDQESAYLATLDQVASFQIDHDELEMFDEAGNSVLVFKSSH